MRIIVLGYIVRSALAGMTWHHLQYVVGLRDLGHDVYFLEDSDDYPSCYLPDTHEMSVDCSYGLEFATRAFLPFGLGARWAYFDAHRNRWEGPVAADAVELLRTADLVLNVSGVNPIREWTLLTPQRALIDTDPVFTQVRHLTRPDAIAQARTHTSFFTFGERVGQPDCLMPDDGLAWQPTRQPLALDAWPITPARPDTPFTTVMQWDSYPPVTHQGRTFGMKSAAFTPYFDLPQRASHRLELAIGSASAPRDTLERSGWALRDPIEITRDLWTYQHYLQASKGEFTVAKEGYASGRCGWFSERSACYLASGRPVITMDTGFGEWLRTDRGVLAFDSPDGALDALDRVAGDYARHCRAARDVAADYFGSRPVLTSLIERATASAGRGKDQVG